MADVVHQLVATDRAIEKLGARTISFGEATQVPSNRHVFCLIRAIRRGGGTGWRATLAGA